VADRLKRLASADAPPLGSHLRTPAELFAAQMTFHGSVRLAERLTREELTPWGDRLLAEEGLAYVTREVATRTQWLRESAQRRVRDALARRGQGAFFDPEETYATLANHGIFHARPKKAAVRSAALEVARPYSELFRTIVRSVRSELMRARHDIAAPLHTVGGTVEHLEALDDAFSRATFARSAELYEELATVLEERFVARAVEMWTGLCATAAARAVGSNAASGTTIDEAEGRALVAAMHADDGLVGSYERALTDLVLTLVELECKGIDATLGAAQELWGRCPHSRGVAERDPPAAVHDELPDEIADETKEETEES
jgi:hypothetical protein